MSAPPPLRILDPQIAIEDKQRVDAVLQTELLDTPPEESFGRLTKLAAKLHPKRKRTRGSWSA